jgi:hypothetical protein
MRDIRDDLRERLKIVDLRSDEENERYGAARRGLEIEHAQAIQMLQEQRKALLVIINADSEDYSPPEEKIRRPAMRLPLKDYFLTIISTRGPHSKDDLKEAAITAGYFSDGANAGRATHATVMNITSSGTLRRLPDGRYDWVGPIDRSLFGPTNAVEKASVGTDEASTSEPMEAS